MKIKQWAISELFEPHYQSEAKCKGFFYEN